MFSCCVSQGSEEILRVVSMNKDYHFECYHCEVSHLSKKQNKAQTCLFCSLCFCKIERKPTVRDFEACSQ